MGQRASAALLLAAGADAGVIASCKEYGVDAWDFFCRSKAPFCTGNDYRSCQDVGARFDHFTRSCDETENRCWTGFKAKCKRVRTCCAGFEMVQPPPNQAALSVWTCRGIGCPAHSTGINVLAGCTCDAGYAGRIEATTAPPYYSGSCSAVPCPANSSGESLPHGCRCIAGYTGSLTASSSPPYYNGSCVGLPCPSLSVGANLARGCSCVPGAAGRIHLVERSPFYRGWCWAVPCPENSKPLVENLGIVGGCVCSAGFNGTIVATSHPPYYTGRCSQLDSPVFTRTLYICIAVGWSATLLSMAGQVLGRLRPWISVALLWGLSALSCGLIMVPSVDDTGALYLGGPESGAVFSEAITEWRAKDLVRADVLGLFAFVIVSAAWSCCGTRPGGRGIATAIFVVASGLLVESALRSEGAHEDVVAAAVVLWGSMFFILLMDSMPWPWSCTLRPERRFPCFVPLAGMAAYVAAAASLLSVHRSTPTQGSVARAALVIVLYLNNEELRRLYEGKSQDSGEGVRALSVFSALITSGTAGLATVMRIEQRYALGLAALTIVRGLMVSRKFAMLDRPALPRGREQSSFISGERTLPEKLAHVWKKLPSCLCRRSYLGPISSWCCGILCRELAAWRWLMQCSLLASLSSIGSIGISVNSLHTDRSVLGISAQDAAWLAIVIATATFLIAASSLLGDQGIKTPIIDRSFRVLATLKPLLSAAKLLVLYCPDSSDCISPSQDVNDFHDMCLRPATGDAGDMVVYEAFGACRVCCVTTNSFGLLVSWKRWSIVGSALFSLLITIAFTFKKVVCSPRVRNSIELRGLVASLGLTRWAFVVLWVSSKLGLTALVIFSRFGSTGIALASWSSGPRRCREVQEQVLADGGEWMPELSTLRMFFAIVLMLALSTIVTNEIARVFDAGSSTRRFSCAKTADGARAMADLLALPAALLAVWMAGTANRVKFGVAFKVACVALVGTMAALLVLVAALGRGSSKPAPLMANDEVETEGESRAASPSHQEAEASPSARQPLLDARPAAPARVPPSLWARQVPRDPSAGGWRQLPRPQSF